MAAKPKYPHLQLAAFRLRTDVPWQRPMYLLRFPEQWKKPLTTLSKPRRDGSDILSVPIALLNQVIAALVPDVITVAKSATVGEHAPWIYSDIEIDTESLFAIIAAWIRASSPDPKKAETILRTLTHSDLVWEPLDIDFATLTCDTGDDELRADELYRLLPHVLAAELSAPGRSHEHLRPKKPSADAAVDEVPEVVEAVSEFRRCPAAIGASVMNWPPHRMPHRPLSFFINITAHSRAFDTEPLIHLAIGTRRWAHKDAKLSFNRDHSVYMLPALPWLPGLVHSRSFLVAAIESWKKPAPDTDEGFDYSARWAGGKIGRILRELGLDADDRLPDPEQLKKTPAARLTAPYAAALVFRNGMYSFDHPVAPGTSLADKVPLVNWAATTLSERLVSVEPLPKGNTVILDVKALKAGKYRAISDPAQLRAAIADTVGKTIGIDIFYDTQHTKSYARATLSTLLGIEVPEDTDHVTGKPDTIITDELTILATVRPVGAWGGPLAGDESITNNTDRLQAAVNSRMDRISEALGDTDVPTISLVEIKGKKSYTGKQRAADPKFAIKVGLSRTGRLAQCVTEAPQPEPAQDGQDASSSDASLEKMVNSWYDLLRQFGVRASNLPIQLTGTSITDAPAYLAFWLIRQNKRGWEGITRQVPVAVLIDPSGRTIHACAPNVAWMPLHRAQHEISRHHMLTDQKRTPEEITRFFERVLRSVASQYPSLLLLTCAQNLRWGWPHLNNPDMGMDTIKFGQRPQDITRYPGLRHVRVRTTDRGEVSDSYAVNGKDEGHAAGYWIANDRIFFSTGEKPVSASRAVKTASKVVPRWKKDDLINARTKAMVWNARGLEYTVAAIQPGDTAENWAALAHDLRWATPHYDYSVSYPWPLMVAKQLAQYVMPLELPEETDVEDDTTADNNGAGE
jgi:pPIWI_RE module N-terminal domain/RNaseH domain of pPIWI_RE/MID domain of pPIWI_RE